MRNEESSGLVSSFLCAGRGIARCISGERNFRIHLVAAFVVSTLGFYFRLAPLEWAVLLLTIGLVLAAECINTAIEAAVDLVGREITPLAARAKDAAAGGVLLAAGVSVGVGAVLFLQAGRLPVLFSRMMSQPAMLVAAVGIVAVSVGFIFMPGHRR